MLQENLVDRVAESIRHRWDHPAFSDFEGSTLTYAEVAHRIAYLHHVFGVCGLKAGDRIALVGRNCSHWAVAYFATITYGAVIVPVLPDFTAEEIHHCVTHSESTLLIVSDGIYDKLQDDRMRKIRGILRLEDFSVRRCQDKALRQAVTGAARGYLEAYRDRLTSETYRFDPVPGESLATIIYTSGTTGFSKGVMLTLHSLMVNVRFYQDCLDLSGNRRIVSFLPLAHCFGCAFDLLAPTVAGLHITFLTKTPTPKVLLQAFKEVRPTVVLSVPLIIEKIYRNTIKPQLDSKVLKVLLALPFVRAMVLRRIRDRVSQAFGGNFQEIVIGGAAFNRDAESFFREIGLPVANGYGMTECGPLISFTLAEENPPVGSVGRVIPYLECRIDVTDPDQHIGEVLVRGENVMLGYYKDSDATSLVIDTDGWLHTGDLGRVDDQGFLYLTGRCKNMILSPSGQNVYPEEIEARLNNLPYVMESIVMDHDGKIVAIIYPDLDRADEDGLDEKQLAAIMEENRKQLNELIPKFAAVSKVTVTYEEFAKTATKKIKRRLYAIGA